MSLAIADKNTVMHFIDYFRNKGINDNGLAGLLGNIYAESGVRCNNLQNSCEKKWNVTDESYTANVDRGTWTDPLNGQPFEFDRGGYGLCQWTSAGRKKGLIDKAHELNKSIADEEVQFEWLWTELTTSYRKVYVELISNSNSIRSCAEIVVCKFEVPASVLGEASRKETTIQTRTQYAEEFYNEYVKGYKMANKIIAINAGHWLGNPKGVPAGMAKLSGTLEFTLNERVVSEVAKMLKEYEVDVLLNYDPTGKTKIELVDRIKQANKTKADIYLSIHHNAANVTAGTWNGGGTTVYYYQGNSKNLDYATRMYNEIKSRTGLKGNRSTPIVGTRNYQEINDTTMPAFIIECAFMNSNVDIEYIAKPEWPIQVASGIVNFLVSEYKLQKKVVEAPAPAPVPKEEPTVIEVDKPCRLKIVAKEQSMDVDMNVGESIIISRTM